MPPVADFALWAALLAAGAIFERRFGHRVSRRGADPAAVGIDRVMAIVTAFYLAETFIARFFDPWSPSAAGILTGALLAIAGLALRTWAMATLGSRFALTPVAMPHDERLVTTGPYRFVRHPGYLGIYLYFLGLGVILAPLAAVLCLIPLVLLGAVRIHGEERLLRLEFDSAYSSYMRDVRWRVLPWIY